MARLIAAGYNRTSLVVLAAVIGVATTSGFVWRDYVSFAWADFDPLLVVCWLSMTALAAWRFDWRRDLLLAGVAFVGGALIESWGTRSGLWAYFTNEKPPLFILPAWPVAALATERLARVVVWATSKLAFRPSESQLRAAQAFTLIAFCILLWSWTAPGRAHPTTSVAYAFVAITCLSGKTPAADLRRFVAGSLLGFLLEYWGTTRACWTYWDGKTPPLAAVLSHGFATIAFARGVAIASALAISAQRMTKPRRAA